MVASYLHMKYLAYMAFEGHIYCWYIYGHTMLDKAAIHCIVSLKYVEMWSPYVGYITSAVGHTCVM